MTASLLGQSYELKAHIEARDSSNSSLTAAWFEPAVLGDVVYKSRQSPYFGACYYFRILSAVSGERDK